MIRVDLATAIVLYLLFSLLLVLVPWIWHAVTHRRNSLEIVKKTALQCNICLLTFLASTEQEIQRCPRCNSWVRIRQDPLILKN